MPARPQTSRLGRRPSTLCRGPSRLGVTLLSELLGLGPPEASLEFCRPNVNQASLAQQHPLTASDHCHLSEARTSTQHTTPRTAKRGWCRRDIAGLCPPLLAQSFKNPWDFLSGKSVLCESRPAPRATPEFLCYDLKGQAGHACRTHEGTPGWRARLQPDLRGGQRLETGRSGLIHVPV